MNAIQRRAMAILNRHDVNVLLTPQGWIWKQDIRESEAAARLVIDAEEAIIEARNV